MSASKIKVIDDLISPNNTSFNSDSSRFGELWSSSHCLASNVAYSPVMPEGLHIGAGFANMQFESNSFGRVLCQGASFQIIQCPRGFDEQVTTQMAKGHGFSGGLHFSDDLGSSVHALNKVFKNVPADTPLVISKRIPFHVAKRLCTSADAWFQGRALELFMEARAYEYLAVASSVLNNDEFCVPRANKRCIQRARDIIDSDLENVPTLAVLASMCACNVRSLTQAFREGYGCTIHEYVTERRMELAIGLLETGLSVSETALQVGYSLGYFSEKFHTHFGFNASTVSSLTVNFDDNARYRK